MANKELEVISLIKSNIDVQKRFADVLGQKRAPVFLSSILTAVNSSDLLQKCDTSSILGAAMIAATLDLPINPNLGFAAIVPYSNKAQFQMMYKGFVQLAIRSGQYRRINVSEVYKDELKSYNPHTGQIIFTPETEWKMRQAERTEDIVGYYAYFILTSGFEQQIFRYSHEILSHGKKYSASFRKRQGLWIDNFDAMARKTVLKELLSKWGILSTEMQAAIQKDYGTTQYGHEEAVSYDDLPNDTLSVNLEESAPEIFNSNPVIEVVPNESI